MRGSLLALFFLFVMVNHSRGARILGVFPVACRSHQSVFAALTQELAKRGHELVVLSPFPDVHGGNASHLLHQVNLMDSVGNYYAEIMSLDLYSYDHPLYYPLFYWVKAIPFIEPIFSDARVRTLLQDKRRFDLVICEDILTEALCGFADYFKVR
jgi:glucuronosyltransferase